MTDQTALGFERHEAFVGETTSKAAAAPWQGSVKIDHRGDASIVALEGEHDVSTAALVRKRLTDVRVAEAIIVDLTPTRFIDSSIASALYDAHRAERPRIRFVVAPGTPPRRLFDLIGLDSVIPVYGRLEDALS